MDWRGTLSRLPRWQKWALAGSIALVVYAVVGFAIAPPIVRSQAEQTLRESFGRDARVGEVRINPFWLSVTVRDFSLPDRDGSPFFDFTELHVDFQISSIFRRAFTFSEIRVVEPFVHVEILPDGRLNFADLLASDERAAEPAEETAEDEEGGPPPLLVGVATIERGRVLFTDHARETPFEHEIQPLDVTLRDFGTRPDDESPYSFTATTGAGETLEWQGTISVVPFYSSGRFALTGIRPRTGWLYIQDDVSFEIVEGTLDVEGRYELDAREELAVRLDEGEIRLRDLAVVDLATDELVVEIPELDVRGIAAAYPEQRVTIRAIASEGGRYHMLRLEDGGLRAAALARPRSALGSDVDDGAAPVEASGDTAADPADDTGPGREWSVGVDDIAIGGFRIDFEDRSPPTPARLTVDPLDVRITDLTNDPTRPIQLALELGLPDEGRLSIEGPVTVEPLAVDLELAASDIDLRPFAPYWARTLAVDLSSGRAGLSGRLALRGEAADDTPRVAFAGDVRIDALRTLDRLLSTDLLSWSALELTGLSVTLEPTAVRLERLTLRDPAVHVVVAPDGTANLATLAVSSENGGTPPPGSSAAEVTEADGAVPVSVGVVEIVDGSAKFEDRSVSPRFSTGVDALAGTVEGLRSDAEARAKVALAGRLDGATPVRIDGELSPLSSQPYLDLRLAFENFELTPLTPYTGRYIGRGIARGKLFVELEYVLEQNVLSGQNELFFDQLTLGEDIESPEAVDLPVGLAIGLMKDRKGEIRIDLPIRGEVDDPEFSVAGLVGRALRNLIVKVATSPFSMMGRLAGSNGEDLRHVEFAPGSAELAAEQVDKLGALAEALQERPALSLELTGGAAAELDRPALQAAALEGELRRRRFRELSSAWFGRKPTTIDEVVLDPQQRSRLIARAYEERFGGDPDEVLTAPTDAVAAPDPDAVAEAREAEMTRRLREEITIDRAALRDLARRRAAAIRDRLVADGLAAERVFVLDVDVAEQASGSAPRATLDLAAH